MWSGSLGGWASRGCEPWKNPAVIGASKGYEQSAVSDRSPHKCRILAVALDFGSTRVGYPTVRAMTVFVIRIFGKRVWIDWQAPAQLEAALVADVVVGTYAHFKSGIV
jgi:hypothetical protein